MLARYVRIRDEIKQRYPSKKPKLSSTATIVHSPTFEAAAVKVINDERLSANERKAVRRFEKTTATSAAGTKRKEREDDVGQGGKKKKEEDFASSILKEMKKSTTQSTASLYSKLLFKLRRLAAVYKQTSVCVPVAMHAIEYDMVFS
ncbi:hypothetical protein PC129_g1258 [Phytophthora cactorum]|uniref:Uncharacterized protein n=1 Tax=Phytophthora cactorum TaxID=29920 RepID=A0A8T1IT47_9STRA|nr:hypothetical protein PC112_g2217 [Phytophthora cactorum]KAG2866955.1 hypothetical protein PC113_g2346 [Phytophthora cactorum]KAG2932146.1 hypothetical protein PC114_g1878 [Phytophthora cactorum]KAG2941934.1 hypothetical protein PC115_g1661 [Phytophthora cactorum]KAG2952801.1 hypothetical protein PC117_g2496 [Phytophthora cactorum]